MTAPRIGSLCSGYAGLDLAVAEVFGAEPVWHCDNDSGARRILSYHYPDLPLYGDLTALDFTTVSPIEILTAGYPCQPFSQAGLRKGTSDERHIWPYIADAIRILRPRLCVFENVGGHLSSGMGDVLRDLAELGYDTRWGCVRASDVGAPHERRRVFILAADARCIRRGERWWERPAEETSRRARREPGGRGREIPAADASGVEREWGVARPQQGRGAESSNGGAGAHADADRCRHVGQEEQREGRPAPIRSGPPADASGEGCARPGPGRAPQEQPGSADDGLAPADPDGAGREHRRRQEPQQSRPAESGSVTDSWRVPLRREPGAEHADGCALHEYDWLQYRVAIERWHDIHGCVPTPTYPPSKRDGQRQLSPMLVEWMMGLPSGWITEPEMWEGVKPATARRMQVKAGGNGVCTPQAVAALRWMAPDLGIDVAAAPAASAPAASAPAGALLPTPTTAMATGGNATRGGDRGDELLLPGLARAFPLLPTPVVNDMGAGKTVDWWDSWTESMRAKHSNGNGHGASLSIEALRISEPVDGALS